MRKVALIRGINVGKAKRVAMADLRREVEALGYTGVQTVLNSGNVVFDVPKGATGDPKERIETVLEKPLGVSARVTVLGLTELERALDPARFPIGAKDPSRAIVTFFSSPADAKLLAPLAKQDFGRESLVVGKTCAWLDCPDGLLAGKLWQAVDRALGERGTARNLATLERILKLARGSAR